MIILIPTSSFFCVVTYTLKTQVSITSPPPSGPPPTASLSSNPQKPVSLHQTSGTRAQKQKQRLCLEKQSTNSNDNKRKYNGKWKKTKKFFRFSFFCVCFFFMISKSGSQFPSFLFLFSSHYTHLREMARIKIKQVKQEFFPARKLSWKMTNGWKIYMFYE